MLRFAYYLGGIGEPNLDKKQSILSNNLKTISHELNQKIDLFICDYSCKFELDPALDEYVENCYIFHKKGILAQLWLQNYNNYKLIDYDFVMLMIDDIDITQLSIKRLMENKAKYDVQIISPMVKDATQSYMFTKPSDDAIFAYTNKIECYCYLFKPIDFFKYLSLHEMDNPYLWGVDCLYNYFNISTGLDYTNTVHHCIKGRCYGNSRADKDMLKYIRKRGFKSYEQLKQIYKPREQYSVFKLQRQLRRFT